MTSIIHYAKHIRLHNILCRISAFQVALYPGTCEEADMQNHFDSAAKT